MNRSLSTRRCAAAATMVIGLGLVAGPLAIGALSRAAAGERLIVGGRAAVGKDAIVQLRSDTNVVIGGLGQLTTDVLPAVSSSLNLDDARFKELLRTRYPAISAGIAGGGSATAALEKTVANLEARREDFRDVDSLPVAGMPLQATTALMMALGGALFLGGLLAWRPGGPAPLVAITALAALAMLGTVVTRSPQKAAAGERVLGSLNITNATAQTTRAQFDGAAAFLAEFQTRLLPDTASSLKISNAQLTTSISQQFPATGALLSDGTAALSRIEGDVRFRERSVEDFSSTRSFPLAALAWGFVGVFALIALLNALALRSGDGESSSSRLG